MFTLSNNSTSEGPEPFITIREVSQRLSLPVFKIRRAVKLGTIPSYRIGNKRALIRLSEAVAAIEQSRFETSGSGSRPGQKLLETGEADND